MVRILFLGGSTQQIPAIQYAKKRNYSTILCDYLPDNPGQKWADKFYPISTTDFEAVLNVAKNEKIDGIVAYASDPAAPTAAYVAEKMGLPSNPFKSVEVLAYKHLFRQFLKNNKFNCPCSKSFKELAEAENAVSQFRFPVLVKPVDSSGSKGIVRIESPDKLEKAFNKALQASRSKQILIEEFIVQNHRYLIGGDCFVLNGKVMFWGLLNCHRDPKVNPLVPVGKSFPLLITDEQVSRIKQTVQGVVDLLQIKFGAFNLELMFDKHDDLYLIEMGPRNGGNMIPDLLYMITGVDLIAATVESALGHDNVILKGHTPINFYTTYNLHTDKNGVLKGIEFSTMVEKSIVKKVIYKKYGDTVQFFDGANKAIGIIFLKFNSLKEMEGTMESIHEHVKILVE